MNIFYTDNHPSLCARFLDDKRLVKMVLETAQILSSAVRLNTDEPPSNLYKKTHTGHPCVVWASSTQGNYKWLLAHFRALLVEYDERYHKSHKSGNLLNSLEWCVRLLPKGDFTPPPNCAANASLGVSFKDEEDTTLAYKKYLYVRWQNDKRQPTWFKHSSSEYINHTLKQYGVV